MVDAWDRRIAEREGTKPHAALMTYLALGPNRSIAKVAEQYQKNVSLLNRWSQKWQWVERARAYDIWQTAEDERVAREKRNAYIAKVAELKYTDPYRRALINNTLLEKVIEPILFGGTIDGDGKIEPVPTKDGVPMQRLYLFGKAGETFNKDPFDIFHQTQQAIADDIPGQRIKRLDIRTLLKAMPTDELVNLIAATEGDPALSPGAGGAASESDDTPEE